MCGGGGGGGGGRGRGFGSVRLVHNTVVRGLGSKTYAYDVMSPPHKVSICLKLTKDHYKAVIQM